MGMAGYAHTERKCTLKNRKKRGIWRKRQNKGERAGQLEYVSIVANSAEAKARRKP